MADVHEVVAQMHDVAGAVVSPPAWVTDNILCQASLGVCDETRPVVNEILGECDASGPGEVSPEDIDVVVSVEGRWDCLVQNCVARLKLVGFAVGGRTEMLDVVVLEA